MPSHTNTSPPRRCAASRSHETSSSAQTQLPRGSSPPRPSSTMTRPISEPSPTQRNPSAGFVAGSSLSRRPLCALILFFGSIIGFLFGFSLASTYAAYHLLDEYKAASATLQASVLELQASTAKVRSRAVCRCAWSTYLSSWVLYR